MEINWVTVAAQIVNFLVLVFLLNRFLYGPITRAMAAREAGIRERLDAAARAKADADETSARLMEERRSLERRREQFLADARQEAMDLRASLENDARDAVDARKRAWLASVDAERREFLDDLERRSGDEFIVLARTVFADLADADFERKIIAKFLDQLAALPAGETEKLRGGVDDGARIAFETAFAISEQNRSQIEARLASVFGRPVELAYDVVEDLIAGARLRAGSQCVEWSVGAYVAHFRESLEGYLAAEPENEKRAAE